jgi:2'-5' RNA ligase
MRVFVALSLDDEIKQKMLRVQRCIDTTRAKVRWSTSDQLHLTLKFIGDVADAKVTPICQAVSRAAQTAESFEIEIVKTGCFPLNGSPRIIWVGGDEPTGTLTTVVQRLEEELFALGIAKETRTFSVHFTIGRVKSDDSRGRLRESVAACTFEPGRQIIRELVLYQSTLARSGAQYAAIGKAPLKGSPS